MEGGGGLRAGIEEKAEWRQEQNFEDGESKSLNESRPVVVGRCQEARVRFEVYVVDMCKQTPQSPGVG